MAVVLVMFVLGGAVAAHHAVPEMVGMGAAVACLAVLAGAVTVAVVGVVRRLAPRPVGLAVPGAPALPAPSRVAARAGPLFLTLLVLRR